MSSPRLGSDPALYANVPGKGQFLEDGTWWTNSELAKVGYITNKSKCIEVAFFDGKPFARWQKIK